jgi:molybdate transport system regulatory protein
MHRKQVVRKNAELRPRWRVQCGKETALGHGRVELLEYIGQTGSLAAAARRMDMSYMRAWTLVKSLNSWFRTPLVRVIRGGPAGGGANLTRMGRQVIALYRRLEQQSMRGAQATWHKLRNRLRQ